MSRAATLHAVPLDPRDLRIDIIRVAGGDPCHVRVTHVATGTTLTIGDQPTIAENRAAALALVRDRIDTDSA
jgi:protein subunit release factor A